MIVDGSMGGMKRLIRVFLESRSILAGDWTTEQILLHINHYGLPWVGLLHTDKLASVVLYNQLKGLTEVHYLETCDSCRGQGFMKQLLAEFIKRQQGRSIWLDVHEQNSQARALYHLFGFRQTGLRKGYYRDGGSCFLMSLDGQGIGAENY